MDERSTAPEEGLAELIQSRAGDFRSSPRDKKAVQDVAFDKFIDPNDDRPGRRTIQISLSLPTQLLDAIDERAKGLGISRAALIKQASALFLKNNK